MPVLLRQGHFKAGNVEQVNLGMSAVVNEGGTGRAALLPGIKVAGKTGTAQLAASDRTKGARLPSALANNAWFVGFAPLENPEIAVVALFENGEESYNAVPIVRDVIKAYFDKTDRKGASILSTEIWNGPSLFARFVPPPRRVPVWMDDRAGAHRAAVERGRRIADALLSFDLSIVPKPGLAADDCQPGNLRPGRLTNL